MEQYDLSPVEEDFDDFGYEDETLDLDAELAEYDDADDDLIDLIPIPGPGASAQPAGPLESVPSDLIPAAAATETLPMQAEPRAMRKPAAKAPAPAKRALHKKAVKIVPPAKKATKKAAKKTVKKAAEKAVVKKAATKRPQTQIDSKANKKAANKYAKPVKAIKRLPKEPAKKVKASKSAAKRGRR